MRSPTIQRIMDKMEKELDKCVLVCSNCHREIHAELNKTKILEIEI